MKNKKSTNNHSDEWVQYQRGIEFKQQINLYSMVDENYRFYQGDQWHGVNAEGLPTPVFNIIKPVLRYKISTIMQNSTSILYKCMNIKSPDYLMLCDYADTLSMHANFLWENLKMDYLNENMLTDASVTGNGFAYFYYDEPSDSIKAELIDGTNIYPQNPNNPSIEEQESIIIAFRSPVTKVRREAILNGMSEKEAELICADDENRERAGDKAKIEADGNDMCIVLLKMRRDENTKTIHFKKSTRNCTIVKETDTGLRHYPIAMMTWENQKNCFFGTSDVTGLIPNQLYINKTAAMMMLSTTFTAFPKMVYDENLVENPSNQIGVAIGVNGDDRPIKNIIDYINPGNMSSDVFNMFDKTITLTKDLMGANDSAFGKLDAGNASGKAILAVIEQSAVPLESVKRRFYNYIEDVAIIWADMLRIYSAGGRQLIYTNKNNEPESFTFEKNMFEKMMLQTKIEVGPATRWSELTLAQTLTNLLSEQYIPFELYVQLMPDSYGLPKDKILGAMG